MFFRFLASVPLFALVLACPLQAQIPGRTQANPTVARSGGGGATDGDFELAEEYYNSGRGNSALVVYRRFLKANPASPNASKAQYRIAEILEEQGNLNKAFDAYQTLVSRYPDTSEFENAVAKQVSIANKFLQGRKLSFLGMNLLPGMERAQQMYESILKNAPYSKHAPIAQFNLGLALERQKQIAQAKAAYQAVLDKYPNSDVADDALYQIAYIYMRAGLSGRSQDLSAMVLAKETYEDFLLQYPNSEKAAQARDNLVEIGAAESGDLMRIAKYYDWAKDYRAAAIYYNDIIRKQPKSADTEFAKARIEELRGQLGDDGLRVGSEKAESGEKLALRRRLQAQVQTSSLADYSGPPKGDIVPDELPVVRAPRLRTGTRDLRPLPPPVEPILPTE